jgi:hypothetical protein
VQTLEDVDADRILKVMEPVPTEPVTHP